MQPHIRRSLLVAAVLAALPLVAQADPPTKPLPVAKALFNPNTIAWTPQVAYRSATLRIAGPGGFVMDRDFGAGKPVFELSEMPFLADGKYVYEIVLGQVPDEALAKAVSRAEFAEDGTVTDAGLAARIAALRATFSGTFTIAEGKIVSPYLVEPDAKAVVLTDADGVIRSSLCVGIDCTTTESFGFDTIRLKENNTRIGFADTSTSTFPANAWQLTANDSASGGANKFSIEDITNARVPFTTTAGAPTNSLFIDSGGRVGFRTATPVLDLHARTGNTPAIRLEQDNSGGFTAQTWDIGANEANFFVRDVTGGSRLPLRIRPGAPTSSVDIAASGNVGVGTGSPATRLHVVANAVPHIATFTSSGGAGFISIGSGSTATAGLVGSANALISGALSSEFALTSTGKIYVGNATSVTPYMTFLTNGNVGVGTAAPASRFHVNGNALMSSLQIAGGGAFGQGSIYSDPNWGMIFRAAQASPALAQFRWSTAGDTELMRISSAGNLGIGTTSPTSKLHVQGDATVTGALHVFGACCGPDYVFDPSYKLASIDDQAAYMWKNRHLPAVGPAKTTSDGRGLVNVFSQANGMLEELEKAHIYIEQLHRQITALKAEAEARDTSIRKELAEIRRQLERR